MKKGLTIVLLIFLFSGCALEQGKVEKVTENGVEVVINHLEPYRIKGISSTLVLEEDLVIDSEKKEIANLGLTDIRKFDVDSEGNIYLFQVPRTRENLVFRFDQKGKFIKSFGQVGQGPGEVQFASFQRINQRDEIPIWDSGALKLLVFDREGCLLKEKRLELKVWNRGGPQFLENDNILIGESGGDEAQRNKYLVSVNLYDSDFKKIRELGRYELVEPYGGEKVSLFPMLATGTISQDKIYMGDAEVGYEISCFDLQGNLLRKIRKESRPVGVPEGLKAEVLAKLGSHPLKDKLYFPENMPVFQYFFVDDEGRLFVVTAEKSETGQYISDIFSPEGIFIGRASLGYFDLIKLTWEGIELGIMAKNRRLYCLKEKESGYKELIVSQMIWAR